MIENISQISRRKLIQFQAGKNKSSVSPQLKRETILFVTKSLHPPCGLVPSVKIDVLQKKKKKKKKLKNSAVITRTKSTCLLAQMPSFRSPFDTKSNFKCWLPLQKHCRVKIIVS